LVRQWFIIGPNERGYYKSYFMKSITFVASEVSPNQIARAFNSSQIVESLLGGDFPVSSLTEGASTNEIQLFVHASQRAGIDFNIAGFKSCQLGSKSGAGEAFST